MSEVCLKCHLPFYNEQTSDGFRTEVRIFNGGVGPFHARCADDDSVSIPRPQYEALWAAAKELQMSVDSHILFRPQAIKALAALRSAGIQGGEGE